MKYPLYYSLLILMTIVTIACSNDENSTRTDEATEPPTNITPNVLLIIVDDMGLDATNGYQLGSENKPDTPTIDQLISNGIRYTNAYSAPLCTPTRAGIITGKYGFRTGVRKVGDALPITETSLQQQIRQNSTYQTAVIGKWHLGDGTDTHPNDIGVGHYAGALSGAVKAYDDWDLTINGDDDTYDRTIRNRTHKYVSKTNDTETFLYNVSDNPLENPNLLSENQAPISSEDTAQLQALKNAMEQLLDQ